MKDVVSEKVDKDWVQGKALREDIALLGFNPLAELHGRLDISWNKNIKYKKLLEVGTSNTLLKDLEVRELWKPK